MNKGSLGFPAAVAGRPRTPPRYVAGAQTSAGGSITNGMSIPLPTSGVLEGDFQLAIVSQVVNQQPQSLAGFTTLLKATFSGSGNAFLQSLLIAYRFVPRVAGSSATLTASGTREGAYLVRTYRGVHTGTPIAASYVPPLDYPASTSKRTPEFYAPAGTRVVFCVCPSGDVGGQISTVVGPGDSYASAYNYSTAGAVDCPMPEGGLTPELTITSAGASDIFPIIAYALNAAA